MSKLVSNSDYQDVLGSTQKVRVLLMSDSPATLYYDGEECGILDINIPKSIDCTIGTHTFSIVSTEYPEIRKNVQGDYSVVDEGKTIAVSIKNEIAKIKRKDSMKSLWQKIKEIAQRPKTVIYMLIITIILLIVVLPLFWYFDVNDLWYIPLFMFVISGHIVLHYAKKSANQEVGMVDKKNLSPTVNIEAGKWVELTKEFDRTIPLRKIRVLMKRSTSQSDCRVYLWQPNTLKGELTIDFWTLNIYERGRKTYIYDCPHVKDNIYEYTSKGEFHFRGYGKNAPDNQIWVYIEERYFALLDG